LNAQSLAPEYPGTVLDTITNPNAPEHVTNIIQGSSGQYRLDSLSISYIDPTVVTNYSPNLNAGERWVGVIHDHPALPDEELAQSNGIDLPTARTIRDSPLGKNLKASYVVGPSGKGPYLGIIVFEPRPGFGSLVNVGTGP
jgi:hypothetical protein